MQVTGGQFKGIKLVSPTGVRPTLSVVRESVFSILATHFDKIGSDFSGLKFLDYFSGSGIMALEAFSRGFEVLAIEKNPTAARIIKENFKKLNNDASVIVGDALRVKISGQFNVVYLDPPWDMDYTALITVAKTRLAPKGVIVCESENEIPLCNLEIIKEKKYGRARLTFLGGNF